MRPGIYGTYIDGAKGRELDRVAKILGDGVIERRRRRLWFNECDESLRRRLWAHVTSELEAKPSGRASGKGKT